MNKIIPFLRVNETGKRHDQIYCPICREDSKPYGLGKEENNKIQLVRKCRSCNELFWYWISLKSALTPFGDT